ncbi:MAG: alpha/beta hydrolase, partial [Actinomycetia bacterium]|nr:alpha/beta hydrolase [Actinomycetes bacterium]
QTIEEARASHAEGAAARPPGPVLDEVTDTTIDGVPVRIYWPADTAGAALVYFHGGGWALGSVDTHDQQCRLLADGSGATVFSVDYRLAPEHPFPAAFEDAVAVTSTVLAGGARFAIDPTRVGVAGDSAGGNLAAAVTIACRDLGLPPLRAQILVYPAVDAEMSSASYVENEDGPFLSKGEMAWFYQLYRGDHPATDWRLSPLHADDLSGLPPALVITAELDPLRDEGEAYAQALAAAGVEAVAVRYAGVSHGFFGWSHVAAPSRQAMSQAVGWLQANL